MRGIDEHTETTLIRASLNLPVPATEIDHAAKQLIAAWSDPSNPDNWLRRPARRTCQVCSKPYKTRMKLLAGSGCCSPECEGAIAAEIERIRKLGPKEES